MKETQTWLKVTELGIRTDSQKKIDEYEHEELTKMLQVLYRNTIVENVINKNSHELDRAFLDL